MNKLTSAIFQNLITGKPAEDLLAEELEQHYWMLNPDHEKSTWFPDAIWESLGYEAGTLSETEKQKIDFVHLDDLDAFLTMARSCSEKGQRTCEKTIRCRHKNGTQLWWHCKAFSVAAGQETLAGDPWLVRKADITEEKENEMAMSSANQNLRKILFGLGDLVFAVDKNFIVTQYIQNRDNELLFTLPSQFVNKHLKEMGLADEDLRLFIITIHESKEEGVPQILEFKLTVNGKPEYYTATASSLKDEDGQLLETIFIATNVTEKRLAEVRLQELSLVGSKTTDLTIITDPFCRITWVNEAFEEHTGYKLEEITGKDPASFLHGPESDPETIIKVDLALKAKMPVQDTMLNYSKDGRKYWVDFRIDPVFNEVGMCSHFISIERDVTERKKAEEELASTRALLLETNRVGKVGGWSYDVAKDKVFWTEVTREIHELPEDFEPTVEKVIQFYKEGESRQKYFEVGMNAIKNGIPYDVELQIVTAKGKDVWVRAIGKVDFKDGVCTRLYGTFQDITSFKKVEDELKQSTLRLQNLTNHVPGCLYQYEVKEDGRFLLPYVSEGILGLSGFTYEEVKENPNLIFDLIHRDDLHRVQSAIQTSYETMEQWQCDYRIVTRSGAIKWVRGISRPQRSESGVTWFGFLQEMNTAVSHSH
jgi:PAS domain S-box-containing protein